MITKNVLATGVALLSLGFSAQATNYTGNGNSGFGGPIGGGSLTLTDDGTTLFGTINKGPNGFNDVLVIYIDTVAGGFSTSAGFTDSADGLRKAISGFDGSNRSTLNFASGFLPDYAIALGPQSDGFGGLWTLSGGGSHPFDTSVGLTPTGTPGSATYTFSLSLASIGLTPGAGQSLELFGTYISNSGYRSDEAVAGTETGAQGWGNTITQTAFGTFTTTPVPEPSTLALSALSGFATLLMLRRRR
jgi:hypothetical protein